MEKGGNFYFLPFAMQWLLFTIFLVGCSLATSSNPGPLNIEVQQLFGNREASALPQIVDVLGNWTNFENEVSVVLGMASKLRQGLRTSPDVILIPQRLVVVAKICFEDGKCWAAKIFRENTYEARDIERGIYATSLIEEYCPWIPINAFRGCGAYNLRFCFSDWIEGRSGIDAVSVISESYDWPFNFFVPRRSMSVPDKLVVSLAEFVYNLTTCPIPVGESTVRFFADMLTMFSAGSDNDRQAMATRGLE
jgi:hypothetical protein